MIYDIIKIILIGGIIIKRFKKVYIEISNICNLKCSFCPGTKRAPRSMTLNEFETVIKRISPFTNYVYLHLLGEPLFHPNLKEFLKICENYDLKVTITTNGTLLKNKQDILLNSKSHYKTVISLHSFEANKNENLKNYLNNCLNYAKAAKDYKIIVFRLWNNGGKDTLNEKILSHIEKTFPKPWFKDRKGTKISNNIYLQFGDKFDWPSQSNHYESETAFCYGLRDQIGVLADGTVVPCCLDSDGEIALGNIFDDTLENIINTPRSLNIYNGFSNRKAHETLCKKCSFVRKF